MKKQKYQFKMNYIEIIFSRKDKKSYLFDLLANELGKIDFESFSDDEQSFSAFIAEKKFDENKLKKLLTNFKFANFSNYEIRIIENENWNEQWEQNYFQPIAVDDKYVIHSSFHKNIPQVKYDIIINPKMAFGTGHHPTTQLMMDFILETQIADKQILDMGCGTAILAIFAMKCGAKRCLAVDIDQWCVENAKENIMINNIANIEVLQGNVNILKNKYFDIIYANINRNILLSDIKIYSEHLNPSGQLFVSGFYTQDVEILESTAAKSHLQLVDIKENTNWSALKFFKK
ncbi:MAG: 50S ribosomal protein L11 methyltransferase [Paludibacter sp.]|nr:50S ribosomal protein L11 methyltransferase [Paludibacter sp.]